MLLFCLCFVVLCLVFASVVNGMSFNEPLCLYFIKVKNIRK